MFVPGKPLPPRRVFGGEAGVKLLSGDPLEGRLLASPTNTKTRLERLARDKHFSLLRKYVIDGREKFYSTGPRGQAYKNFLRP